MNFKVFIVIFLFSLSSFSQELKFTLSGKVTENITLDSIPSATIKLVGSDNSLLEIKTDSLGKYFFDSSFLKSNTSYIVSVNALNVKHGRCDCGYMGNPKAKISTINISQSTNFVQDFVLKQILDCCSRMPIIYFSRNSFWLEEKDMADIKFLFDVMKENPNIVVQISANGGFDEENPKELSFNRAKTVVDLLIKKGIDKDRLVPFGYGNSKPAYIEMDTILPSGKIIPHGTQLTKKWIRKNIKRRKHLDDYEIATQFNRRVVFMVLRKDYVPKKK